MSTILSLAILVADIWAIIQIWGSNEEAVKKVIWTLVVLILPVIGLAIWWFMGPKKA